MSVALVQVTAECPHCDVRKWQIDANAERAQSIVSDAIARHVREDHPEAKDVQR